MTTYYVGPGGNDGSAGTSWATRKLTLNGAEDIPVAPTDTVYVGPGVYRETLTVDVGGTGSATITYIGDVTGENTDGIGGIVRLTGSDNDKSGTRANCITSTGKSYRTFRGFMLDTTSAGTANELIRVVGTFSDWTIEDCSFQSNNDSCIVTNSTNQSNIIIRRCIFYGGGTSNIGTIWFYSGSDLANANHLVENCIVLGGDWGISVSNIGGVTIKNCLIAFATQGIRLQEAPASGQKLYVYNSNIIYNADNALSAASAGYITEDYNNLWGNGSLRSNVTPGSNSVTYPPLLEPPLLLDNYEFPWWFSKLSEWSQVRAIKGTGTSSDDLFGIDRPLEENDISWGAIQFQDIERETGTVHGGIASAVFHEPARKQIWVPVENEQTIFSCWVYRDGTYSGTAPQMQIIQPGQSNLLVTDTGAVSQWNKLAVTGTVAATPPYAVVELISNHANTGSSDVFFDDLDVS